MTIAAKKERLIERINRIKTKREFEEIERVFHAAEEREKVMGYVKTKRAKTDVQQLIKEQNYKTENIKGIFGCLADDDEPLEEMLASLTK